MSPAVGRDDLIERLEQSVLDGGIALSASELATFGFKRGRKREGYRGDYYALPA